MEYVDGGSLSPSQLEFDGLAPVFSGVLDGLEAAHQRGIIHRDLKPSNILRTKSGQIKIVDFGLAKAVEDEAGRDAQESDVVKTALTRQNQVLGSPPYMSPEQVKGAEVDHRSDLFSLGVMLYEILSGSRPFQGDTPVEVASSVLKETPPPIKAGGRFPISDGLKSVLDRSLEKDPAQRFQSVDQLRHVLFRALDEADARGRKKRVLWRLTPLLGGPLLVLALYLVNPFDLWAPSVSEDGPESLSPNPEKVLLEQGRALTLKFSAADNLQAIRLLDEVRRNSPGLAEVHSLLALAKLKRFWWYQADRELMAESLEAADLALRLNPGSGRARVVRDIALTLNGPAEDAYLSLAKTLRQDRAQIEAAAWIAYNFFAKAGRFEAAGKLLSQLESSGPNPYRDIGAAFVAIQASDISVALPRITDLQVRYPDSDAGAFLQCLAAIQSKNLPMLDKGIRLYDVISPGKPGAEIFRVYGLAARGILNEPQLSHELLNSDYEYAALYGQILARLGKEQEALSWLERSLERGSYNLIQLNHDDFSILKENSRFVTLQNDLKDRIDRLAPRIEAALRGD
jgi:tetratricopeptide (TPR) repeat protein